MQITLIENFLHAANVIVDGVELVKLVTVAQESNPDQDQDHSDSPQTPQKVLTVDSTTGLVYFDDFNDSLLDSKMDVNIAM